MPEYTPFNADGGEPIKSSLEFGNAASFLTGDTDGNDVGGFDPAIHISRDKRNADGSFRRKRERKSNTTPSGSKKAKNLSASVDGLARILSVIHIGVATVSKTPELKLDDEEAELLAKATAVVLDEFDVRPDPRVEAVIGLITAAGSIYAPRVYLIRERKKLEKANKENGE